MNFLALSEQIVLKMFGIFRKFCSDFNKNRFYRCLGLVLFGLGYKFVGIKENEMKFFIRFPLSFAFCIVSICTIRLAIHV